MSHSSLGAIVIGRDCICASRSPMETALKLSATLNEPLLSSQAWSLSITGTVCPLIVFPALDSGLDNSGLKCRLDSAQVIIYRAASFCQHVTAGWLPADSGSISFRQMRQKIEVKMICAIKTYRCVQRQDHRCCVFVCAAALIRVDNQGIKYSEK